MSRKRRPTPPEDSPTPAAKPAASVHHLALDRIEAGRDGAPLAVLVTDDGVSIVVPRALLPAAAAAGMALTLTLTLDPDATAAVARETEALRTDLKKTDPGGTIRL